MAAAVILGDIASRLKSSKPTEGNLGAHRELIQSVCHKALCLSDVRPTPAELSTFLQSVHDLHVRSDSAVRGALLRAVRLSVETRAHFDVIVAEEWQFLIVASLEREQLERDQDFLLLERMQALKLIKKIVNVIGKEEDTAVPGSSSSSSSASSSSQNDLLSLAQSLVAVASHKGDSLRRVALETLREMSLYRPRIVAVVNGFTVLMESIFEPGNADMNDSIILSFLYVLNDPNSRKYVRPYLDLRTLLAPFTDLDFSPEDGVASHRWKAAKAALVTVMRSWVGVIYVTSDDLGLPTLIRMLNDIKVSSAIQNAILDTVSEIFRPLTSTVKSTGVSKRRYAGRGGGGSAATAATASAGVALTSRIKRSASGSSVSSTATTETSRTSASSMSMAFSRSHTSFSTFDPSTKSDGAQTTKSMALNLISGFFSSAKNMASPAPKNNSLTQQQPKRSSIFSSSSSSSASSSNTKANDGSNVTFMRAKEMSMRQVHGGAESKSQTRKDFSESDPLFNATGSYSALLCCAFIHAEIIDSLCFLGVHGEASIATKSRTLLVEILRIVARIFPEDRCAELLTVPSLIEFAAAANEKAMANRAHKASQILTALADAFTVLPTKPGLGKDNGLAKIFAQQAARQRSISAGRVSLESAFLNPGSGNGSPILGGSPRPGSVPSNGVSGSNFYPMQQQAPVSSVWDLCDEMQWIGQSKDHGRSSVSVAKSDVMQELRLIMTATVDRNDFTRQMDVSRVIGKEGKEPFRWDWPTIQDMLEYSFQHPDRLVEAMKSKWMKRVSGFYRCTNDEKGFFANLSWDASNLHYLECACSMYHVLVDDPQGLAFLRSDRRGILFNELSKELKDLYDCSMRQYGMANYQKNVFRLAACQQTMAREYFSLLGRVTLVESGRSLLDETPLVFTLSLLGTCRPLDYLSRIAVTSLAFTDHGYMSQLLIKSWWASGKCSADLKCFILNLLSILVYARPNNFRDWCIDVVVAILSMEDPAVPGSWSPLLVSLLEQMAESKANAVAFLAKSPAIAPLLNMQRVLVRLMSVPEGVSYLSQPVSPSDKLTAGRLSDANSSPLSTLLNDWRARRCREYVRRVDALLVKALSGQATANATANSNPATPTSAGGLGGSSSIGSTSSLGVGITAVNMPSPVVKPIVVHVEDIMQHTSSDQVPALDEAGAGKFACPQDSLESAQVNFEGLLRVPWNIEVKLVPQATYGVATSAPEFVKVDCFVDKSDMCSSSTSDVSCDADRLLKIRAVVLDDKGLPCGRAITSNKTILNCLLAGVAPVSREGKIFPMGSKDPRAARRKSATLLNARDSMTTITKRQSLVAPSSESSAGDSSDAPVTSLYESQSYDWSSCKPGHRQGKVIELGDNKYSVEIAGEPCVWIFSRVMPGTATVPRARTGSLGNVFMDQGASLFGSGSSSSRSDASRSGINTYLLEVVYYIRIETGQAIFATLPRHLYAELSRNHDGLQALGEDTIRDLLSTIRRKGTPSADMRASLWALGHIASTEFGYAAVTGTEPGFVEWCVKGALGYPNFAVRGTFFQILGLISRTPVGARCLQMLQWDSAAQGGSFAVSIPRNPALLFAKESEEFDSAILQPGGGGEKVKTPLTPDLTLFLPAGSDTDLEVLNLIAKLPGLNQSLLENKARLDRLRAAHPEIFTRRELYLAVQRVLETNFFRLTTRRYIHKLFSTSAKCKESSPDSRE